MSDYPKASCLELVPVPFTSAKQPVNVEVVYDHGEGVEDHVGVLLLLVLAPEE